MDDARAQVAGFLAGSPDGGWLPGASAAELVSCYGVPLAVTVAAATEEEAAAVAAKLGGPVVLKAEAEGLVHRTGAGGVQAAAERAVELLVSALDVMRCWTRSI